MRVVSVTAPALPTSTSMPPRSPPTWSTPFDIFPTPSIWPPSWGADRVVVNSSWGLPGGEDESAIVEPLPGSPGPAVSGGPALWSDIGRSPSGTTRATLVCNLERARRMHREVGHPSLKMMVDNIATGAAGETLGDWFRAFGAELIPCTFWMEIPGCITSGGMAAPPWPSRFRP